MTRVSIEVPDHETIWFDIPTKIAHSLDLDDIDYEFGWADDCNMDRLCVLTGNEDIVSVVMETLFPDLTPGRAPDGYMHLPYAREQIAAAVETGADGGPMLDIICPIKPDTDYVMWLFFNMHVNCEWFEDSHQLWLFNDQDEQGNWHPEHLVDLAEYLQWPAGSVIEA